MPVAGHDATRLFIQAIFSRRFVSERVAQLLYKKSCETVNAFLSEEDRLTWTADRFLVLIGAINNKLEPLELKIVLAPDEITGRRMLCLINQRSDDLAQSATEYAPAEIAFYKAIIEEIATAPNESFSITSMVALRQLSKAKVGQGKDKMTRAHGEVLLDSFVASGWLAKSMRGRYTLGTRARIELSEYLSKNFEELEGKEHICSMCDQLVLSGVRCPHDDCGYRIHRCCLDQARKLIKCPTCGTDWSNLTMRPIGEDALRDGGDDDGNSRRRVQKANKARDDDDDESEEERPRRISRKNKRQDDSDDDGDAAQMEVDQEEPVPQARRPNRRRG